MNISYEQKYLKYKKKYIDLKNQSGGAHFVAMAPQMIAAIATVAARKIDCKNVGEVNKINPYTGQILIDSIPRLRKKIRQWLCYNEIRHNYIFVDKIVKKLNDWVQAMSINKNENENDENKFNGYIYNNQLFSNIKVPHFKDTLQKIISITANIAKDAKEKEYSSKNENENEDLEYHELKKLKHGRHTRSLLEMAGVTAFKKHTQVLVADIIKNVDCANNFGELKLHEVGKGSFKHIKKSSKKLSGKANKFIGNIGSLLLSSSEIHTEHMKKNAEEYNNAKKDEYIARKIDNGYEYVNMECLINLLNPNSINILINFLNNLLITSNTKNNDNNQEGGLSLSSGIKKIKKISNSAIGFINKTIKPVEKSKDTEDPKGPVLNPNRHLQRLYDLLINLEKEGAYNCDYINDNFII